jgi:phosphomannomutase
VNVVDLRKKRHYRWRREWRNLPESHYGRDSLWCGLVFNAFGQQEMTVSLRASYRNTTMSKTKIELTPQMDVDAILVAMTEKWRI